MGASFKVQRSEDMLKVLTWLSPRLISQHIGRRALWSVGIAPVPLSLAGSPTGIEMAFHQSECRLKATNVS
jgi:hypothetical protein